MSHLFPGCKTGVLQGREMWATKSFYTFTKSVFVESSINESITRLSSLTFGVKKPAGAYYGGYEWLFRLRLVVISIAKYMYLFKSIK